jgi:uncharacterized protein YbgA (DUF1722 family)/uncharacterized protein YbbK (DUF523 family)
VATGNNKILLAASACLLGEAVRYDGGHKRHAEIVELGQFFDFLPLCPETAIGLGVPRPPIHLVAVDTDSPRALGVADAGLDPTAALEDFGVASAPRLQQACGYLFKSRSPSCGLYDVPVIERGEIRRDGRGVYARALLQALPWLPVEDENGLADPLRRECFFEQVYTLHRWRTGLADGLTAQKLVAFHSRHKLLAMAHSPTAYRRLGRCLAQLHSTDLPALAQHYLADLLSTLQQPASRQTHCNALQHLMGYLKKQLSPGEKAAWLEQLEAYRLGHKPLSAPKEALRQHFQRHPHTYVAEQCYWEPYPALLKSPSNSHGSDVERGNEKTRFGA